MYIDQQIFILTWKLTPLDTLHRNNIKKKQKEFDIVLGYVISSPVVIIWVFFCNYKIGIIFGITNFGIIKILCVAEGVVSQKLKLRCSEHITSR